MLNFFAHSLPNDDNRIRWQPLDKHLRNVGRLAQQRAAKFGYGYLGYLAGSIHDLGKYAVEFQDYIGGQGESIDHATAGAQAVMQAAQSAGTGAAEQIAAQLAAFAVAGHHSGLPDRVGETGSLAARLKKTVPILDPMWRQEVKIDLAGSFPTGGLKFSRGLEGFQLAFLGRFIFSAVVDADYLDTEAFYCAAEGSRPDRIWPRLPEILPALAERFDTVMARKREAAKPTRVNELRAEILTEVRGKAALPKGVYTLNVPTGGGKTLTSLAFALDHARAHAMERIVYAIPFTSIIDQTATIFSDILGDGIVLEHHSSIEAKRGEARESRDKLRLAMEDWAAPVIITTTVQLFESLFADRPSRCRKLHALANAVIILDEAQTLPLAVLRPCVAALGELARNYGATIVLCTATQPALAAATDSSPGFESGFAPRPVELAPDPHGLHRALQRVTLHLRTGPVTDEDLVRELAAQAQALVIVNSRKHALALHRAGKAAGLDGLVHLSTRQIAVHRREALADIRKRLKDEKHCRVVATSLIEAGIDISFPRVWRAEAGLDQIAQAAGRCNREGGRAVADSVVTVFQPAEAKPPAEIEAFAAAMRRVAERHADLFAPEAIQDYFREVYWQRGAKGLDKHDVMQAFKVSALELNFAYRTVGERFRLIESGMEPVIVPADDIAQKAIRGLELGWLKPGAAARELQTYTVQVPPKARQALIAAGRARFVDTVGQFAVLTDLTLYTRELGLLWEDAEVISIEDLMI
jgi:CRISPR-associated endonuclease/helicase Cas3